MKEAWRKCHNFLQKFTSTSFQVNWKFTCLSVVPTNLWHCVHLNFVQEKWYMISSFCAKSGNLFVHDQGVECYFISQQQKNHRSKSDWNKQQIRYYTIRLYLQNHHIVIFSKRFISFKFNFPSLWNSFSEAFWLIYRSVCKLHTNLMWTSFKL